MIKNYLSELDARISQNLTPVAKWIMYVGCVVFLVQMLVQPFANVAAVIVFWIGCSLDRTVFHANIWQVFTYAVVHSSFINLLFNMLAVYFFGQRLEERWGSKNFLRFALIIVVVTALTHLIICTIIPGHRIDTLTGMSGLVFGLLFASAWYYPDDIVYFQMLFPIKIKYVVAIIGFMTFLSGAGDGRSLANLTPLGGFLAAFLYVKFPGVFESIPIPWSGRRKAKVRDIGRNRRF